MKYRSMLFAALAANFAVAQNQAAELHSFRSSKELEDHLEAVAIREMEKSLDGWGYRPPWRGGPVIMTARAAEGSSSSHSTTNVQVAGVDEPDFVKNDARYVYKIVGEAVVLVDTLPSSRMRELSRVKIEGSPFALLLHENLLVVLSRTNAPAGMERGSPGSGGGPVPMRIARPIWYQPPVVKITVVDVSSRKYPSVARETYIEGDYVNARRVDAQVHLVTSGRTPGPELAYWTDWSRQPSASDIAALKAENRRRIKAAKIEDWIQRRLDRATQSAPSLVVGPWNCYGPRPAEGRNLVTVTTLDIESPLPPFHAGALSERGEVYASSSALYLSVYRWDYWWSYNVGAKPADVSDIHKFELGCFRPRYLASGQVDGRVLNQFSMDEWQGQLRVATTTEATAQENQPRKNHVFVLGQARPWTRRLDVVGSIRDLAPDERIYSCRFIEDRGFVVTFRQVDPLFAIDMRRLEVKGVLKVDGFSTYMHPMGANGEYLLTVGNAADDQGRVTGLQLSIFDVRDLANPKRIQHRTLPGAYSESLYEHKAFTYFPANDTLVIPVSDWQNGFSGLEVYDVKVHSGFQLRGRVDHGGLAKQLGWTWAPYVNRSIILRKIVLFSISDAGVKANRVTNPKVEYGSLLLKP